MAKKALENLTETMFYVLMAYSQGEKCGVEAAEFIKEITKGRVCLGPATLYTILGKFEKEKILEETSVEGRKRTYTLTEKGRMLYQTELNRLLQCVSDAKSAELKKEG